MKYIDKLIAEGGQKFMKRTYETPMACSEEFMPNEYVAACYMLACYRGSYGMSYNGQRWNNSNWNWHREQGNVTHSSMGTAGTCGDATANRVITSEGGVFQSVGEYNNEQGWLNGGLENIIQGNGGDNSATDPGDIVFWYTTADDGRRWNHWGIVQQEDPNHPNHS